MKRLIGCAVRVYLDAVKDVSIYGVLMDVTSESAYIENNTETFIVPRQKVLYCTIENSSPAEQQVQRDPPAPSPEKLSVYINKEHITDIPVPPTFPLDKWSENIFKVAIGNPDVRSLLAGKIQRAVDYYPGEVYITVEDPQYPIAEHQAQNNSFAMSFGGSPEAEFLNPSQMVARLQNTSSKKKVGGKDGKAKV